MLKDLTKNHKIFVADTFNVPTELRTPNFTIRVLRETDTTKDYEAVIANADKIRGIFGPYEADWPTSDLTPEQDKKDLAWHESEFDRRTSFTYTVVTPDETRCLGCVYIFPSPKPNFDAIIFLWTRSDSTITKSIDSELFNTVNNWLAQSWPFKKIAFPGRTIPWTNWI